jgi:predicted metal-dependent HD superfamily phosphohydrolase
MDKETVEELGWDPDPFNGLKILKGDMDRYYDSDPEIQKSEEKIQYYKTLVETLTEIVSNINWRHQTIGNIIKWKQFESGS